MMPTKTLPKSIESHVLNYATAHLGLSPEYLRWLKSGVCFGLAASAALYQAEGYFALFLSGLHDITHNRPSLEARAVVERCFFLQSPNIQSQVSHTTEQSQSFAHTAFFAPVDLQVSYYRLSDAALLQLMQWLQSQQPVQTASIIVSLGQHAVALIIQKRRWWFVDSLRSSVVCQSAPHLCLDHLGIRQGQQVHICLVNTSHSTVPLEHCWFNAHRHDCITTQPWALLHFGAHPEGGRCPVVKPDGEKCGKVDSFQWHQRNHVYICNACCKRQYRAKTLSEERGPCQGIDNKGNQCNAKFSFQWHKRKSGNQICDACYRRQKRAEEQKKKQDTTLQAQENRAAGQQQQSSPKRARKPGNNANLNSNSYQGAAAAAAAAAAMPLSFSSPQGYLQTSAGLPYSNQTPSATNNRLHQQRQPAAMPLSGYHSLGPDLSSGNNHNYNMANQSSGQSYFSRAWANDDIKQPDANTQCICLCHFDIPTTCDCSSRACSVKQTPFSSPQDDLQTSAGLPPHSSQIPSATNNRLHQQRQPAAMPLSGYHSLGHNLSSGNNNNYNMANQSLGQSYFSSAWANDDVKQPDANTQCICLCHFDIPTTCNCSSRACSVKQTPFSSPQGYLQTSAGLPPYSSQIPSATNNRLSQSLPLAAMPLTDYHSLGPDLSSGNNNNYNMTGQPSGQFYSGMRARVGTDGLVSPTQPHSSYPPDITAAEAVAMFEHIGNDGVEPLDTNTECVCLCHLGLSMNCDCSSRACSQTPFSLPQDFL